MKSDSPTPKGRTTSDEQNPSGSETIPPVTLAEWAAHYAAAGLEVFPVDPDTKAPLGALARNGHLSATKDADTIRQWWTARPDASIGARIPENVVVLDIDPRHDGLDTWDTIVAGHDLPVTRCHASGRNDGGFHIWFRNPNGHELKDRKGIDVLHHGHRYSILPPSLHPETGQPYTWVHDPTTPMADLPEWLAEALTPAPVAQAATKAPKIASNNAYHGDGPTPAEWYNDNASWSEILEGWRLVAGNGEDDGSKWAHPTATAAFSATIRHECLFVYSPTPGLPVTETNDPNGLTKFKAAAELHYGGDMAECARDIRRLMPDPITGEIPSTLQPLIVPDAVTTAADEPAGNVLAPFQIDWATMWTTDHKQAEWLLEPILAAGRNHSFVAAAKAGKSLLLLEACAALATGKPFLAKPETEPVTVVYVDYEMTEGDIKERLQAFGYGPDDDLTRLRYFTTPTINPLDTEHGAAEFLAAINEIGPDLVAIDTMSRAVSGEENESQTSNDLYRLTIMPLKAAGITVARADHLGKDQTKGARGSSAKAADVDIQWQMKVDGYTVTMEPTARMGWVETVHIVRDSDPGTDTAMHTLDSVQHRPPWDAAEWIGNQSGWVKVDDAARAMTGNDFPEATEKRKARDALDRLHARGEVERQKAPVSSTGGRSPHLYRWIGGTGKGVDSA